MEGGGGGGNTADGGGLDETCAMFSLTKTQRLWGFGICLCIGFVLSLMVQIYLAALILVYQQFKVLFI